MCCGLFGTSPRPTDHCSALLVRLSCWKILTALSNRTRAEKQALLQKLSLPTGKSSPAGRAGRPKKTNLQRKTPLEPLRKSARLSSVKEKSLLHPPDGYSDSGDDSESYVEDVARSSRKRKLGGGPRSHNPTGKIYKKIIGPDPAKSFGSVPGINVGHWWEMRIHAGNARIHPVCFKSLQSPPTRANWLISL